MLREFRSIDRHILKMGMADTVRNSLIALPVISLFEAIMMVRWFLTGHSFSDPGDLAYFIGYAVLFGASITTLAIIRHLRKDVDRNYLRIYIIQAIYAVIIVLWALEITFVGSYSDGYFDYLVYVTIVIIVPLFCFLSPLQWAPIQFLSSGAVFFLASHYNGFQAFIINFSVFTIISMIASTTLFLTRLDSYQRLIELEQERDQSRHHAFHDALTDLPNRRCYIEDLNKAESAGLTLAMFDVNGLKQVNDTLGHDAGDELLKGAAHCLAEAFSGMGTIYRVGGDEYTGILYGTKEELSAAMHKLVGLEDAWKGKYARTLSISAGTASAADHGNASIKELETIADDAMYAAKQAYYHRQ